MSTTVKRPLVRTFRLVGAGVLAATLLMGCNTDLASLIQPEIKRAPIDNPLASAIQTTDAPNAVNNAGLMNHINNTSGTLAVQSLPGGVTNEDVEGFADELENAFGDFKDTTSAMSCDLTFSSSVAAIWATHCGALAQNINVDDIAIDEDDVNLRSVYAALDTVKMDITLEPEMDLTFENLVYPPDTLKLWYVSLALSVQDDTSKPPAYLFITADTQTTLTKDRKIDPANGIWRYTLDAPTVVQDLSNRVVSVELSDASEPMSVLNNNVEPNTVSAMALLSVRSANVGTPIAQLTSIDFEITLGETLTLESGN